MDLVRHNAKCVECRTPIIPGCQQVASKHADPQSFARQMDAMGTSPLRVSQEEPACAAVLPVLPGSTGSRFQNQRSLSPLPHPVQRAKATSSQRVGFPKVHRQKNKCTNLPKLGPFSYRGFMKMWLYFPSAKGWTRISSLGRHIKYILVNCHYAD